MVEWLTRGILVCGSLAWLSAQTVSPLKNNTPPQLPSGSIGVAYSYSLIASGGTAPYSWTASALPPGIALQTTLGTPQTVSLAGTPTSTGSFTMTTTVSDASGATDSVSTVLQICSANLRVIFVSLSPGFNVPTGIPVAVVVNILDGCGIPADNASVVGTFSNGDPPISFVRSGAPGTGLFSATWLPRNPQSSTVTITVSATLQTPFGATTVIGVGQIGGTIGVTTISSPAINPSGVVSAISFQAGAPVAVGSFVSIFGQVLSEATTAAATIPLPMSLGGTSVMIGGKPMPLLFVSPGQINVIVPYDTGLGAQQVVVLRNGAVSTPVQVAVAAAQPAIISKDQSGKGQGVIVNVNGQIVDAGNRAKAGDIVVVYCSGLGQVNPAVTAGSAPTGLSQTVYPVHFQVGGAEATILYSGLTPGFAQLYQVNATVPAGVHGDAVTAELLVDLGSSTARSGSAITMAVQ